MSNKSGLTKSSSPSRIQNSEHVDSAGAKKVIVGTGKIKEVVADSTADTALAKEDTVRMANTGSSTAYVWVGEGSAPGSVDSTNGLALPAGHVEHLYVGDSEDQSQSMVVKASSSDVQLVILKS